MESPENQEEITTHRTEKLAGTVNWGTATVVGIFAGMLYGGSKEAYASVVVCIPNGIFLLKVMVKMQYGTPTNSEIYLPKRIRGVLGTSSKDAEVMLKLGSTPDKREQHRLMRDAMEKRFVRVTRGSLIGGIRLGMFTAAFYGLQNLLAEKRGVIDVYNVVGAGSATASTFGLILPGSFRWRLRNAMLGSVLGAAICFPVGWLHLKLVEKANGGTLSTTSEEAKSGIAAAVERLEGKLNKRA